MNPRFFPEIPALLRRGGVLLVLARAVSLWSPWDSHVLSWPHARAAN